MRSIKIGLLGFGNVGTGVYKILNKNRDKIKREQGLDISINKILVKDIKKRRIIKLEEGILTDRFEDIIEDKDIDIVAEFMGGENPVKEYIIRTMESGKTVVTANKEVLAKHWEDLEAIAVKNSVGLYYEASVGGGIPVIRAVHQSLQGNRVERIMGIINGTTNYILTKMSDEGREFQEVLGEAQKLGYAEPDPTSDIEGYDAMYKLSILSTICFHQRIRIDDIYCEGIAGITPEDIEYGRELGYGIKLLALAKQYDDKIEVRVHPTFIPVGHPLYAVRDAFNAIFIYGDAVGELMLYGRGAGDLPTGSAVVSDIITACKCNGAHIGLQTGLHTKLSIEKNWVTDYFIRLTALDRPGVLAEIAGIFAKYNVSINSVIQKGRGEDFAPIIFVTHDAAELSLRRAVEEIRKLDSVKCVENIIRVEK